MKISPWTFYPVVLLPAAVLMALEIVSSRLLAPQFGSSVYVWGSIIGIFLAAMSVGYAWGGRLADRRPSLATLGSLLLASAVVQAPLIPFGRAWTAAVAEFTGGSPAGTLLAAALLFGPATVCLSTVSPYAVKLATKDLQLLGVTAGYLYALSTAASLMGTLAATFVLIPYLQLDTILRLLLALTVLPALIALTVDRRRGGLLLGLLLLLFAGFPPQTDPHRESSYLVERITPYQTLQIYDEDGVRYMIGDGVIQSAVDAETGAPWLAYPRQAPAALLIQPEIRRLLVLGMGAGSVATLLHEQLDDLTVDFVDIDPAVPELARKYLHFQPQPGDRVHIDDARRFLRSHEGPWDYIYADTYIGLAVPFHLTTVEFFEELKPRIAPGGVLGINLATHLEQPFARAIVRSVKSTFTHVAFFSVPGWSKQLLVLASDTPLPRGRQELITLAQSLEERFPDFDPPLTDLAQRRVLRELDLSDAYLLTDRFAPVHHLIQLDSPDLGDVLSGGPPETLPTEEDSP